MLLKEQHGSEKIKITSNHPLLSIANALNYLRLRELPDKKFKQTESNKKCTSGNSEVIDNKTNAVICYLHFFFFLPLLL